MATKLKTNPDGRGKHGKQGRKKLNNKNFQKRVTPEVYKKLDEFLKKLKNEKTLETIE